MRGGFAGVVAVPAWGRFMKAATAGDAADWYEMPADVEKVAICRLSGARATDACRHPSEVYSVSGEGTPQLVPADAMLDEAEAPPVRTLAAGETPVYEDLFPLGAVSSELCPLHNPNPYGIAKSPRIRLRPRWSTHLSRPSSRSRPESAVGSGGGSSSPWQPGPPPPTSSSSASSARTA